LPKRSALLANLGSNEGIKVIATIGGIAGAVGLGAYVIYVVSGQSALTNLDNQLKIILADYLDEVDRYVKADGPNGLTQAHKDALAAKVPIIKNITDQEKSLAAQGLITLADVAKYGIAAVAAVVLIRWGAKLAYNYVTKAKNSGVAETPEGMYSLLENAAAVNFVDTGDVALAQGWFNNGVIIDVANANAALLFQQQQINSIIGQLQGIQLVQAQLELASIANDLVVLDIFTALARVVVFP
jgi:hypothetical protein